MIDSLILLVGGLGLAAGILAGFILGWFISFKNSEKNKDALVDTFKALSGETLKSNNRAFLDLAKENLEGVMKEAKGDLGQKEEAIKGLVKPLEETLKRYEQELSSLEKTRAEAYGSLENQIKNLLTAQKSLEKETGNLVGALRRPEVRGRWGEVTLKRVAELAGMTEYCDYSEQVSVDTEGGRQRPDMVVHLPAGRDIVVDSKVSLDAFLDALNCDSEEDKDACLNRHAQHVKKHMKDLASKAYWTQFKDTPEFVVMFIPGESFLSAALQKEPSLIEEGMASKVIISTPTTLIALLRAIAYGWRQEQVNKNAQEIAKLGKELYDRFVPFMSHVNRASNALSQTVVSFNKMIMSLERRVMVSVRKFKELGSASGDDLEETKQIEQVPMDVNEGK